jgi:hypothetical protein
MACNERGKSPTFNSESKNLTFILKIDGVGERQVISYCMRRLASFRVLREKISVILGADLTHSDTVTVTISLRLWSYQRFHYCGSINIAVSEGLSLLQYTCPSRDARCLSAYIRQV